ncbi:hypothetical protein [Noviherbaspirillum sp. Root189]|uniref:hypothetical protein n=1 Tax=Noviherbaspirillum sp. Root189 TaxID=1736487 RepID=UPI00070E7781|nr:hypothetical protein [Noviherbaspirillum sp. Root189]KRB94211.1 hypothetical protein ASE07_01375 [Noviherbaspirillum sp. Root189]
MNAIDSFLLGDSALYARLCMTTEVLGQFVSCAPRSLTLDQLERLTRMPVKDLLKLCVTLCREQVLRPHPEQPQCWVLACETSELTLEDAFRCVVSEQSERTRAAKRRALADAPLADTVHREVDMLVMQATMGINQSVFQHLRQFSLDRLKMTAAGMFPARRSNDDALRGWPPTRLSFS